MVLRKVHANIILSLFQLLREFASKFGSESRDWPAALRPIFWTGASRVDEGRRQRISNIRYAGSTPVSESITPATADGQSVKR